MDPIIIGILIIAGFMGLVITLMKIMLKAKKQQRNKNRNFDDYDPFDE